MATEPSKISSHQTDIIFGYIKIFEKDYQIYVPIELIKIVYLFFPVSDRWSKHTSLIVAGKHNNSLTRKAFGNGYDHGHSTIAVAKGEMRVWHLEMIKPDPLQGTFISYVGIVMIEHAGHMANTKGHFADKKHNGYAYDLFNGKVFHRTLFQSKRYGVAVKQGDILAVELDMISNKKAGILKFYVNGKDFGIAYNDIDIQQKYVLAVGMIANDTVALL
eukprot:393172_1